MSTAQCGHPLWKYPNPYPSAGERCPDCDAPFAVTTLDRMSRKEIEDLRALAMLHALPLMADDKVITPTQKSRLRYRIAKKRGWVTATSPELEPDAGDMAAL